MENKNINILGQMLDPIWGYAMGYGDVTSDRSEPEVHKQVQFKTHTDELVDVSAVIRTKTEFQELRFSTPLLGVGFGKRDAMDESPFAVYEKELPKSTSFQLYHMKVNLPGQGGYVNVKDDTGPWNEYLAHMLGHILIQMRERGWDGSVHLSRHEAELAAARSLFQSAPKLEAVADTPGHEDGLKDKAV